ncbi:hypothetical protein JCM11251_004975 [Rhodosporidiobolus azoricus]
MRCAHIDGFSKVRSTTRNMVRHLRTDRGIQRDTPKWYVPFVKSAGVAAALPNLEGLEVTSIDSYGPTAPGWRMFNRLARTVLPNLARLHLHLAAKERQLNSMISLGAAAPLKHLDPTRLTRLSLTLLNLSPADLQRLLSPLNDFQYRSSNSLLRAIQALKKLDVLIFDEDLVELFDAGSELDPLLEHLTDRDIAFYEPVSEYGEYGEDCRTWSLEVDECEDWAIL